MSLQLNGTDGVTFNDGSEQWAAASPLGTKNLVINGDMNIAQRGTSTTGLQYNKDNNFPCCDRWKFQEFGSTSYTAAFTGSQDTDVPSGQGFIKSLKLACTTADTTVEADTQLLWSYNFEGQMLQHLKFGTSSAYSLTLSFWVKSNLTGTFAVSLYNADNVRHATHTYSISAADTWEKITLTFSGDTVDGFNNDNAFSLSIRFVFAAGSNHTSGTSTNGDFIEYDATRVAPSMSNNLGSSTSNYINITGVQLEVGDTATPFEHRPLDMELQRCQRYYEKSYQYETAVPTNTYDGSFVFAPSTTTVNQHAYVFYSVRKRTNGTVTGYNPVDSNTSNPLRHGTNRPWSQFRKSQNGFAFHVNNSSIVTNGTTYVQWVCDAEL